ncbi:uncharacterized protein LOC117183042 [Belonocnema kinseyi]|uniref:uncharacterized protein LOC117183042 n=1 Tax=Belonocnema kinseyi TaxID=2817044 RepID=UPI00143D34E8|nr:uncharacterized protein LOC117183042 [Belonocnema kinseyi]
MGSQLKFTTYCPSYKQEFPWVDKSQLGNKYAFCAYCSKDFKIDSMGRAALVSHTRSGKHTRNEEGHTKSLNMDFFLKRNDSLNNPTILWRSLTRVLQIILLGLVEILWPKLSKSVMHI